jgi:antitoxin component YwqK of YwqJK toxin-antitoxin module
MMIKKIVFVFLLFLLISSCSENIDDSAYRNTNYVFYQQEGKKGYWQEISSTSDFKYKKGQLTYFYANGNKFAEVEVIDSFPNRKTKFYDTEEKLVKTVRKEQDSTVKIHLENGYYKHSYSNMGTIIMEGLVENNLEQSVWKKYRNEDGTLRQIIEMKDGFEHGKRENYWPNGRLKDVSYWDKGKQIGEGIMYYKNGNVKLKNVVKKGQVHGLMEKYYSDGTLKSTGNYWYGALKDSSKKYYENGILKNKIYISLDTITGISIGQEYRYYPSGKIEIKSDIKNDLPDGIMISYYENGEMEHWVEMTQNNTDGKFITYFKSGGKKMEGKMKDNVLIDNLKYFNEKGNLIKTMIVENGNIIDSILH